MPGGGGSWGGWGLSAAGQQEGRGAVAIATWGRPSPDPHRALWAHRGRESISGEGAIPSRRHHAEHRMLAHSHVHTHVHTQPAATCSLAGRRPCLSGCSPRAPWGGGEGSVRVWPELKRLWTPQGKATAAETCCARWGWSPDPQGHTPARRHPLPGGSGVGGRPLPTTTPPPHVQEKAQTGEAELPQDNNQGWVAPLLWPQSPRLGSGLAVTTWQSSPGASPLLPGPAQPSPQLRGPDAL